jgi:peptidoglycan hydrolase-like amidase
MSIGTNSCAAHKAAMKETSFAANKPARKAVQVALSVLLLLGMTPSVSATAKAPVHKLKASAYAQSASAQLHSAYNPYPPMINPVRVGLGVRAPLVRFALWMPGFVYVNGQPIFDVKPQMVYSISNGRITELATGRSVGLPMDQRSYVSAPPDYRVWTGNRWYRGCLELISFGNRVSVINLLDLEDYLLGVVPSEMPANWCMEALKAQAVAARSYAWAHVGDKSKWRAEGFDVVPDVRDQAYSGLAREARSTFVAVQQTRGLILKDSGRVKAGFYRAWVGDDQYENLNIRKTAVPTAQLEKMTGVKEIIGVTVKQWDASGNAHDIQVMGAKKSREVYGVALAHQLGFSTAGILDVREDGPNWVFTYRGPGNGARGLSQHGANMLASKGWHFDQILTQYYQDPDGKLRLDYIDTYKQALFRPVPHHKIEETVPAKSDDD